MIDEIICQECGRPNLQGAEKCWYCQSPIPQLQASEESTPDEAPSENLDNSAQGTETETGQKNIVVEEVPDWLKRIRALKAKEMEEQEAERIRWQQQALFAANQAQSSTRKKEPKRQAARRSVEKPAQPEDGEISDQPPELPEEPPASHPRVSEQRNGTAPTASSNDDLPPGDLPEGFIPLERD